MKKNILIGLGILTITINLNAGVRSDMNLILNKISDCYSITNDYGKCNSVSKIGLDTSLLTNGTIIENIRASSEYPHRHPHFSIINHLKNKNRSYSTKGNDAYTIRIDTND